MQPQTPLEKLKAERDELEREFREVTRQAQQSPCLRQISARKKSRLMERVDELEEQIEKLREQVQ